MRTYYGRVVTHKHRKFCFILDRDKPTGAFSGLDWYGTVQASSLKIAVSRLVEQYLKERSLSDDGDSDGANTDTTPHVQVMTPPVRKKTVREAIQSMAAFTPAVPPKKQRGRPKGYRRCAKCNRMHLPEGKCP